MDIGRCVMLLYIKYSKKKEIAHFIFVFVDLIDCVYLFIERMAWF